MCTEAINPVFGKETILNMEDSDSNEEGLPILQYKYNKENQY